MIYTRQYCREHDVVVICNNVEEYQKVITYGDFPKNLSTEGFPIYVYECGWDFCKSPMLKGHNSSVLAPIFLNDNSETPFTKALNKSEQKAIKKLFQKLQLV